MNTWSKKEEKLLFSLVNRGESNREISKKLGKSIDSVDSKLKRMKKKHKIKLRKASPDTKIYSFDLSKTIDIVGLALYWSEGSKQPNRIVEFVNADPETIRIFMKFLRNIGIDENRLRARVKIYDFQNLSKCEKYWADVTGIKLGKFHKPIIREVQPKRDHMLTHYGTLTIRYHSLNLFKDMNKAVENLKLNVSE